jgi:lysophospholipase L1-like esterase
VSSWTAAQQLVETANMLSAEPEADVTLRQIVHVSLGGTELRVHLSNRFGDTPLHVTSVHIARPVSNRSSAIDLATDVTLHFCGRADVTIPAGADYLSDPVPVSVAPLSDLTITLHLDDLPARQTGHPGSRATSYWVRGDHVAAAELPDAAKVEHWYFLAAVDVGHASAAKAVVAIGDSITDGHGATTEGNDRWTDVLARRLQANPTTRSVAVLNQGIGGNRLLLDGLGPNAMARFGDDVLAPAGVRYVMVLEGVNDVGMLGRTGQATAAEHKELVAEIIAAYEQMIARAHTHSIKIIGCTILPFAGSSFYHPGPEEETDRREINQWIRTPGHFDAVIDFDRVMRDPTAPNRLLAKFDSGDHLHPSPAGYAAMAKAVPLALFESIRTSGSATRAVHGSAGARLRSTHEFLTALN